MTPERIEEIKGNVKTLLNPEQYSLDAFHNAADIMDERKIEWIVELLDALEAAQQTIARQQKKIAWYECNYMGYVDGEGDKES